jgi:hypothetical protein
MAAAAQPKPPPPPNIAVKQGNPPFKPVVMPVAPLAGLSRSVGAAPNPYASAAAGAIEDGPSVFQHYDGLTSISYNGQNQTKTINQNFRP